MNKHDEITVTQRRLGPLLSGNYHCAIDIAKHNRLNKTKANTERRAHVLCVKSLFNVQCSIYRTPRLLTTTARISIGLYVNIYKTNLLRPVFLNIVCIGYRRALLPNSSG